MKRLFPPSLALLLIMASLGHVLAASFCPRALGGVCCSAKSVNHPHSSTSSHENVIVHDMHMDGMSMHDMNMDDMEMGDTSIDHHAMEDMVSGAATVDVSIRFSRVAFGEEAVANKFDQPVESCAHCLGHSSIFSAPISTVSVSDQSNKDPGGIPSSVSRSLARPAMRLAQIGRPREHAPPGSSAPRHVLINVFLI